eukprot:GGOE01020039.1.p2 GENE.GGOE01020039.1~~GGOE01020039.1.p2  ORF type:complete len:163 (+),score=9.68 GGOE01020039.1:328-816(+)
MAEATCSATVLKMLNFVQGCGSIARQWTKGFPKKSCHFRGQHVNRAQLTWSAWAELCPMFLWNFFQANFQEKVMLICSMHQHRSLFTTGAVEAETGQQLAADGAGIHPLRETDLQCGEAHQWIGPSGSGAAVTGAILQSRAEALHVLAVRKWTKDATGLVLS